jgi:rhodanese-related sulfurtransferase
MMGKGFLSRKNLWQMLALIAASTLIGLGINFFAAIPLPLFRSLPAEKATAPFASLGEVDADFIVRIQAGSGTVLLDARPAAAYEQGHIPGAVSLPLGNFAESYAALESRLRQAGLLVVYCSDPTCGDSPELARLLWNQGLKSILLYRGGMEDWSEKGHDVEK